MKNVLLKYHRLILIAVIILAFFLRFYKLGEVPNGLYQDETAIGYNAYSILQTGKDEYGKILPLYFKSFGDQKLPVYIYATVVSEKLFGVNEFAVRFPSALFGSLTVVVLYFFVKILTKNKTLALFSTALLAINPWSLDYNRATFEVSISLFLFVAGSFLLLKSFDAKKYGLFLLGTILFILCLYSYNLTRLLSPLLYIMILVLHRKKLRYISKSELIITIVLSTILLIPFVLLIFSSGGAASASGTLLFSSNAVKAPLLEFRSYFIYTPLFAKLFFNTWMLLVWQYINNIVTYFSTPFFFVSGSSHGNHGIGNVGQFYIFELPFIIGGIILFIKNNLPGKKLLLIWAIIVVLVASLTRDIPQATRSIFLVIPMVVFCAAGIISFLGFVFRIKKVYYRWSVIVLLVMFISYSLIFYFSSYYIRFPILYAKQWREQDKQLVSYLVANENKYDRIIFDTKIGFIYTSYLFYSKYSPVDFYGSVKRLPDDNEGFSKVQSFGKIEFKDVDWSRDFNTPGTLIVTNENFKPNEIPSVKTFHFPVRPVVISVGEVISEFPVKDAAYVLLEKN